MNILKKIFLLSIVILFLSLLLWGVYNLSFKKPDVATQNNAPKETEEAPLAPVKDALKIKALSSEAAIAPVYIFEENTIKYFTPGGQVHRIDPDGSGKSVLSAKELPGLSDVIWSPDQTKAIAKFVETDGQTQFYYYDYLTQTNTPIKKNVDEIAWQTSGNRIFYKYYDQKTKKRSLNISDPDGSNWTKLADIDYRNISIAQIPKSGLVSFWNKPDSYTQTTLETIPLITGERKMIYKEKFGADYLWSKDGNLVLISSVDVRAGSKIQLAVMNYNGGEYRNLDIPTFVSKCAWSQDGKTIYYTLPGNIPSSAILPNEYMEGKFKTTDTFWKVNVTDGKKTRLLEAADIKDPYDATNLFLSADESVLFFTNKNDSKIYRIEL